MKSTFESAQVQPALIQRLAYEEALNDWFRDYEFKYFYTLTFRFDVSVEMARASIDSFAQKLSKKAFGGSWNSANGTKNRVSFVAGLEAQSSSRLHWHVAMQSLDHSQRLSSDDAVESAIRECWAARGGSIQQFNFQLINKNKNRVISYLLKEVKYDTDTFYGEWFSRQK